MVVVFFVEVLVVVNVVINCSDGYDNVGFLDSIGITSVRN